MYKKKNRRSFRCEYSSISLVVLLIFDNFNRGYSSELRTLSSGKANLSMELSHYQVVSFDWMKNRIQVTFVTNRTF